MRYDGPLIDARFVARRKRFLCDVVTRDGEALTAHVANTGAMTGCTAPDAPVRLRDSRDPKRKLRYSVEQIEVDGHWIVVNTARANQVVDEALRGTLGERFGTGPVYREVRHGDRRIDFGVGEPMHTLLEVKSVTMLQGDRLVFPDAVTERGRKHVEALAGLAAEGRRGVLLFLAPREGGVEVGLAEHVDPRYARAVRDAVAAGVRVEAWRARPTAEGILWGERLPVVL